MTTKQIYLVPGFGSTPNDHWFPWITSELISLPDLKIKTIKMPNPQKPKITLWLSALKEQVTTLDENTYFVTHSLGGLTTLLFLTKLLEKQENKLGGIILVSGFYQKAKGMSSPDEFFEENVNFDMIKTNSNNNIIVISSANDYIVPTKLTDNLAIKLDADYYRKRENGHFMGVDGYTKFPLLLTLISYLYKNNG